MKLIGLSSYRRYTTASLVVLTIFAVANALNFRRRVMCWDCFFPYGLPFTLYQEGGEGGGAGIVWTGLVADVVILILTSALVGWIWTMIAMRHSSRSSIGEH